jgi:acetoin utilization deacetylase AcuC-like enzyme
MAEHGGGHIDPDTYVVSGSYQAALAAAGALVGVVEQVMGGAAPNGMSLMRPPGHHALAARGMGFCLFANVAIAARAAQSDFGAERVLIVDWDVHHGNGTEAIFYDDPTVAFFSTHQYPFYPGTGAISDIGRGPGRGWTMNVPFPAGVGDSGYEKAFEQLLFPFARRFQPDLILVSAGYDAHWRDPLAMENLSLAGYARLTTLVKALAAELCQGRLVIALEGGYDLEVLAQAVLNTLRVLESPLPPLISDPFGPSPTPERPITHLLSELRALHDL